MNAERSLPPLVLVVEDEALIRWSIRTRLDRAGYRVEVAGTGGGALARLGDGVDLVLLDLRLPDADGMSVLAEIRRRNPACRVIVMTAYGHPELEEQAAGLGALCVLKKPFDLEQLTATVGRAVRSSAGTAVPQRDVQWGAH